MDKNNFSFIGHDYIKYLLEKKQFLYTLIVVDSYIDLYIAWIYRLYCYKNDKKKLKEFFNRKFKTKKGWGNINAENA